MRGDGRRLRLLARFLARPAGDGRRCVRIGAWLPQVRRCDEVEAIVHCVGSSVARVKSGQSEERLAKLDDADVGVLLLGDVAPFRVRTEYETSDSTARKELLSVGPALENGWIDVIVPAAPIIPGDEDRARPHSGPRAIASTCCAVHVVPSVTFERGCSSEPRVPYRYVTLARLPAAASAINCACGL